MKLLIISHTEHYTDASGEIKGWGPTVREINFLATKFDEIIHMAILYDDKVPDSSLTYTQPNIRFVPLPPSGGTSITSKLKSLFLAPGIIKQILSEADKVDLVQLRVPTGMANYLIPFFTFRKLKPLLWIKYAGNWNQEFPPAGYRFQRWWLRMNFLKCKVTINGKWEKQPAHCFTFENPCLDAYERIEGRKIIENKEFHAPYTASFIGRIEEAKGVRRIIDALPDFSEKKITTIHFVGEGQEREYYEKLCSKQNTVKCIFHGRIGREKITNLLAQSHFMILPSTASEGFPKVIAEGINYGAIPLVSDISSIGQYINDENGFIWDRSIDFSTWVKQLKLDPLDLKAKCRNGFNVAESFTFENYYHKLQSHILNDH